MLVLRASALAFVAVACIALGCSSSDDGSGGGGGSGGAAATTATTTTGSNDPLETYRERCMTKINALRATKGLAPYARWTDAETCVDQEVSSDEMTMSAHGAWLSNAYPCNGNGQNECLGQGAEGIESCLDLMWAEKDQPSCSGCDACAGGFTDSCANCDFYGTMSGGKECGHYVNLSAEWLAKAACGFSSLGTWDAINFSQ